MSYINGPIAFDGMAFTLKNGEEIIVEPNPLVKKRLEEYLNAPTSGNTGVQKIHFDSLLQDLVNFANKQAEEDKKYFSPTVEDLHVGYECEMLPINESKGWHKVKLYYNKGYEDKSNPKSIFNLYPFWFGYVPIEMYGRDIPIICQVKDLLHLRVPYLTREQIEKEGWEYNRSTKLVISHSFIKGNYKLSWYCDDKKIIIHKMKDLYPGSYSFEYMPLYNGNCPSINELRTIMKLLNIK